MRRFIGAVLAAVLLSGFGTPVRAEDNKDVKAILDKAIKALGGEEKLAAAKGLTWKGKGVISIGGNDSNFTQQTTTEGMERLRSEFEGDFGGNQVKGVTVLNGDKCTRKFGDMKMELDKDGVANEKRVAYLQVSAVTILPLKGKDFKVEAAGEEKVGDKAAVCIKVTPADGKEFKLCFDKESGLPVKQVAKVLDFMGTEFTQETTFDAYKDFGGIKKATKVVNKRDGEKFLQYEISEFKAMDKIDAKTFSEPE